MSNARKLQTEIDRVLKKVDEGTELFNEITVKVRAADSQNLKEKHEADLKKEIKKLQRLRDQIKTWISSSDVKDKGALLEARKLIEYKMEEFKICEKETKTKTYSKEGLAREEKLDPEEEAKQNTTGWLQEYVERFQTEVDEKDFEIERLSSGKGKKTNKHQIEGLLDHINSHKFHIAKLEGIIRLVNNDVLEVDAVDAIKDDLDYYLDSHQEEDFQMGYDEEFFYETLGLDELDVITVDHLAPAAKDKKNDDTTSMSSKGSKDVNRAKKGGAGSVIPITIGRARTKAEKKLEEEKNATPAKKATVPQPKPVPVQPIRLASSTPSASGESMAAILKRESEQQEKERQKVGTLTCISHVSPNTYQQLKQQQEALRQQQLKQQEAIRLQQEAREKEAEQKRQEEQQEAIRKQQAAAAQQRAQQEALQQQQLQAQARSVSEQAPAALNPTGTTQQSSNLDAMTIGLGGLSLGASDNRSTATDSSTVMGSIAQSTANAKSAVSEDSGSSYLTALHDSFATAPGSNDAERSRQYQPQNPYPTPASYPSTPSAIFENPVVFEKLGTDCLFFIFYYAQGTYQQYLAARELKKQSWRFHKKYMAWFQRHEEPKITTDEYEQGTYVYFDYETGWCQRIKQDFRFEYSYLEDSLQ